jgi:dihydroorotase
MNTISIIKPDDWHIHLRDHETLKLTVEHASKQFKRVIVMPNLTPPVVTVEQALAYRERILNACPSNSTFSPLMTLYLTEDLTESELLKAKKSQAIHGVKLYPAGATTNSESGVNNLKKIFPILEYMQKIDLPLLIHGEIANPKHDIFDREHLFLRNELVSITTNFPKLRVVLEHITTKEAVEFIQASQSNIAATITAHHLLYNRNHLLNGGIRPHYYCLPILKRSTDQHALITAATSGNPKFFLGTDSAPHFKHLKESACGCAGCYTAYAAIEMYAEVFERANALDKLQNFASVFGPNFYQLPHNKEYINLTKKTWTAPESFCIEGKHILTPLRAGEDITWCLSDA